MARSLSEGDPPPKVAESGKDGRLIEQQQTEPQRRALGKVVRQVPTEILNEIFHYVPYENYFSCAMVNRKWAQTAIKVQWDEPQLQSRTQYYKFLIFCQHKPPIEPIATYGHLVRVLDLTWFNKFDELLPFVGDYCPNVSVISVENSIDVAAFRNVHESCPSLIGFFGIVTSLLSPDKFTEPFRKGLGRLRALELLYGEAEYESHPEGVRALVKCLDLVCDIFICADERMI